MSEEVIGRALHDFAARAMRWSLPPKFIFAMGQGPNDHGLSRKHILSAIDASLKRLGTDYVDLYQIHRWDYDTPIEETMEALHDVVRAGKARYIGASAMYAWQFAKALYTADLHGWTRFVSMQPHYNLIYREEEREMLPLCQDQKIAVIPFSPLARGLADPQTVARTKRNPRAQTDAVRKQRYDREDNVAIVQRVSEVAEARGLPMAQVALAWMLSKPVVTAPIIGATKPHHLEDAVAALSVQLTPEEIPAVRRSLPASSHYWFLVGKRIGFLYVWGCGWPCRPHPHINSVEPPGQQGLTPPSRSLPGSAAGPRPARAARRYGTPASAAG